MVAASQNLFTPRDVARIVFRHWRKMALFAAATMGLTLLAIALFPRSYRSEAKLFIRVGRESVALDPTATTGETIMLQKTQADEVNSAMNLLTSREVLRQAVEKVGAERICKNSPRDTGAAAAGAATNDGVMASISSGISNGLQKLGLADPGTPEDQAIRHLERQIKLWAPKDSTVITIQFPAASPQLAHDVVQAVTDAFLSEHLRLSHTDGSLEFFSEQTDKLYRELTTAQNELRDRMSAFQMTAVGNRRSILEKEEEAMRQKLYDLELRENDLKSRYTDAYPILIEVRRQRADTEKRLTEIAASRREISGSGVATKGDADSRSALVDELKSVNEQELQIAQLTRDVELLENKYRMHVEKMEQARVNDAMGNQVKLGNVKVAQAASLVHKPVSPNKAILIALGMLTAIAGSIGLAFLLETLDQTLRTTGQVEAHLGLPVLLSLPQPKRRGRRLPATNGAATNGHAANGTNGHNGIDRSTRFRGLVRELMSAEDANEQNGSRHALTIGIVGCEASKMRSQVAANLAIQAAATGAEPVLLIDADARQRRVTKRFHINGSPGWREVISGAIDASSCVHKQDVENLSVMSPGTPNGHEPVKPAATSNLGQLNEIKSEYGLVVVDMPAERDMEAAPTTKWLDETVLVVEAERTRIQSAQRAKEQLERAGVRVTGVVLANRREHIPSWLYQRL
ncbi:MAG: GumC family protein [Pirellulales bacterium]